MQRHEMDAWLGDDHGLTEEQITELMRTAEEIAERYPDPDDTAEREAALTAAYRVTAGDDALVAELAGSLTRARMEELRALAGLRQAAVDLIGAGRATEAGLARDAGLDRMTVRGWLGKR